MPHGFSVVHIAKTLARVSQANSMHSIFDLIKVQTGAVEKSL